MDNAMRGRILIVEDETALAEIVQAYLIRDGFEVTHLDSGGGVVNWVHGHQVDLILLDVMLPEVDGFDICKTLRKTLDVPIIITTARVEEIDRLIGLELGADDYVCKPYSPRELVSRVKAVLRRSQKGTSTPDEPHAALDIRADQFEIWMLGKRLDLTPSEFKILALLGGHPGRVWSRAQLLDAIERDVHVSDRVIDSHIKNLRKKMADVVPDKELIRSIYGAGYRLELN